MSLVWSDPRIPTVEWVPDGYGDYWQNGPCVCCTVCTIPLRWPNHPPVPPWLTNRIYDKKTGRTWWQFFVHSSGLSTALEVRSAFLRGFEGPRGTFWCGSCYEHCLFLRLGESLGYPDVSRLYTLPETQGMEGYGCWLWLARFGGSVLVGTVVMLARQQGLLPSLAASC
jgi:hypothetical protein